MRPSDTKFSILIGFRNRDITRVVRCIESFDNQTVKNFELIFVDYGSDTDTASSVQALLSRYPFVNYLYNDTRGWFWNRAHALNTALINSKGTYIISSDIDMIHAPNFIELLEREVQPKILYHYRCYYLPEKFDFETNRLEEGNNEQFSISSDNARGLIVVEREACIKVNGWNEKFKIYGGEDSDMSQKLTNYGLQLRWLPIDEFTTYHQWHPSHKKSIEVLPHKWKKKIYTYLTNQSYLTIEEPVPIGQLFVATEREALNCDLSQCKRYKLNENYGEQIFSFLETFSGSESGRCFVLFCDYHKELYRFQKDRRTSNMLIDSVNFILKKCRLNVGLQLSYLYDSRRLNIFHLRDTLFYLLEYLLAMDTIRDYTFTFNEKKIELVVIRKPFREI